MSTITAASASLAHVQAAHDSASPGDTVQIPAGAATWGAGGAFLTVNKAILLEGAGIGVTTITLDDTASTGTIRVSAAAVVKGFTIVSAGASADTAGAIIATANGFRISDIQFEQVSENSSYFLYAEAYGLMDNCFIYGGSGTSELVFVRGPVDSWQTASSMGTADAMFIEDCYYAGSGYVCDGNDNSRMVVRGCEIHGPIKVDGHGYASNSLRGVRQMEIYDNVWPDAGYFTAIEVRGGTGMVFNNSAPTAGAVQDWFFLTDYAYLFAVPNFGNVLQQPSDYPLKDQIGVGIDPKAAASEPLYLWGNTNSEGAWPRTLKELPGESEAATEREFIQANRDFFADAGFDDATGVTVGTLATMAGMTPVLTGYGFWATDDGTGKLYRWDGDSWALHYTPYEYPHPLQGVDAPSAGGATAVSITCGSLVIG